MRSRIGGPLMTALLAAGGTAYGNGKAYGAAPSQPPPAASASWPARDASRDAPPGTPEGTLGARHPALGEGPGQQITQPGRVELPEQVTEPGRRGYPDRPAADSAVPPTVRN